MRRKDGIPQYQIDQASKVPISRAQLNILYITYKTGFASGIWDGRSVRGLLKRGLLEEKDGIIEVSTDGIFVLVANNRIDERDWQGGDEDA